MGTSKPYSSYILYGLDRNWIFYAWQELIHSKEEMISLEATIFKKTSFNGICILVNKTKSMKCTQLQIDCDIYNAICSKYIEIIICTYLAP